MDLILLLLDVVCELLICWVFFLVMWIGFCRILVYWVEGIFFVFGVVVVLFVVGYWFGVEYFLFCFFDGELIYCFLGSVFLWKLVLVFECYC